MENLAAEASIALVALVALATLAAVLRLRRTTARRLNTVVARLGGEPADEHSLERTLARLERASEEALFEMDELRTAADRHAEALRHVDQGVVVCNEAGDVVLRNEHAQAFVGARHGEVIAERAVEELLQAALAGQQARRTIELFGPPRRTLTVTAFPLDNGVRTVGAAAVIDDISERRRLESVRRDFVANMSHELKTPIGGLGLLAETIATEDDPAVIRRLAERMQIEAMRVARIIDDLLDLSRIESEEAPRRDPVPVHLILAEAVERLRPVAEHRRIEISAAEPPRRLRVVGDRRQLVSAVHHLVENAIKYSDEGSTVEVGATTDGSCVDFVVRDHGVGIPARDLERIFERFYRVDRSRARDTGGTGLGLSIVRHIAANHGGEVRVESREGQGSTFTLRLPAGPGPVLVTAEAG